MPLSSAGSAPTSEPSSRASSPISSSSTTIPYRRSRTFAGCGSSSRRVASSLTVVPGPGGSSTMRRSLRVLVLLVVAVLGPGGLSSARGQAPAGQMTLVYNISIVPRWFDPAESEGLVTPFIFYYAIHDALVKPMPGNASTPCLAESWSVSADGLTYEFGLRKGVRFHNGETVSADDVKFSYERYHGASARTLKDHVASVEVVDQLLVRFRLKRPWP